MTLFGQLMGLPIYSNPHAEIRKQVRFPKTRKRRIQKKWSKNEQNFKMVPQIYLFAGNKYIAHPTIIMELRRKIDKTTPEWRPKL